LVGSTIGVVIATLNEEEGIGPTILELREALDDPYLLVVDGRSVDRTVEIAKNLGAEIELQDGLGKGLAISQGIKRLDPSVEFVVFVDADFTYPAEHIPQMIEILKRNPQIGMIIGNRFSEMFNFRTVVNDVFYFGNRLIAFAQHILNGIKLRDPLSGLRVVRSKIIRSWDPKSKSFDVEAEMNFHVERKGFEIVEVPIKYRQRVGDKKLKLKHGVTILKRIFRESLDFYRSSL
jgi:dolichol-phosphate mannosyltransferase